MWRKNTALLLILTLTSVLLSPGCATLTRSQRQRIPVTSSPAGATVTINKVQRGVTPLDLRLARKARNQVIRIEYPGYNPLEIRMRRSISAPHVMGNGLLGGIAGCFAGLITFARNDLTDKGPTMLLTWALGTFVAFFLFDMATGAGYAIRPNELTVTLTKAGGTPRVDTVLIDAEDFRNVKWIRVHRD